MANLNEKYFSLSNNIQHEIDESQLLCFNNSFNKSREEFQSNNPSKNSREKKEELYNILDNLNKEKKEIISKLKNVEEKLEQTQMDNQLIYEEKENLQADLEALLNELENTKMQMAYSAEEKKQAETLLKKEIKILIKKLIKTKGKLINQTNISKNDCGTNSSMVNLSGFINFYNQNKENSTFGDRTVDTQMTNCTESSFLNQNINQVFSNSLFTLANKSNSNSRNKSQNISQKSPKILKENYSTPNKFENSNNKSPNQLGRKQNLQLLKPKNNESTSTKLAKKIYRYNN